MLSNGQQGVVPSTLSLAWPLFEGTVDKYSKQIVISYHDKCFNGLVIDMLEGGGRISAKVSAFSLALVHSSSHFQP